LYVTKNELDTYFTINWNDIEGIIKRNEPKAVTKNSMSVASEIYTICVNRLDKLDKHNLLGFIGVTASNMYRWKNSSFNRQNVCTANDYEIPIDYHNEETERDQDQIQRLNYALEKYYLNALPHEKKLYDLFVNQEVRSIRELKKRTGVTFRGSIVLLNEFKQKIKQYEREA